MIELPPPLEDIFTSDVAKHLYTHGVVVVVDPWIQQHVQELRTECLVTIRTFPEFKSHPANISKETTYVLGGFSALGNPSSFHNPFVRKLREWCMFVLMKKLFRPFVHSFVKSPSDCKIEQVLDRMMVRPPLVTPTAESWHRDEAPLAEKEDITFGGWINLDLQDQHFSCVPKSHKQVRNHSGFGKISKEEIKMCKMNKETIVIPPGGILVFYEHILHEVVARKKDYISLRLFLGWRLTKSVHPMIPGLRNLLMNQAVMPLKSNQIPPMYARLHWINWRVQLQKWSQNMFVDSCREQRRVESGSDKGICFDVVHMHMRSLADYGMDLYKEYSEEEIRLLEPHPTHYLLVPGSTTKRVRVRI
jgi:hypothetical protein